MASDKTWYWLAAGILALGISSDYQKGGFQGVHSYVQCTKAVVRDYAHCAQHYLADAYLILASKQASLPRARVVLMHDDVQFALDREEITHRNLERQWPQIERAQRLAIDHAGPGAVLCPHRRDRGARIPTPPALDEGMF